VAGHRERYTSLMLRVDHVTGVMCVCVCEREREREREERVLKGAGERERQRERVLNGADLRCAL
jgi:hypothetical protein